jgi:hypothetical protein
MFVRKPAARTAFKAGVRRLYHGARRFLVLSEGGSLIVIVLNRLDRIVLF